jgi:hypothetical protein
MEVCLVFRVDMVVHLYNVFLNAQSIRTDLVVLAPRFRAVALKDSRKIELHFMLNAHIYASYAFYM